MFEPWNFSSLSEQLSEFPEAYCVSESAYADISKMSFSSTLRFPLYGNPEMSEFPLLSLNAREFGSFLLQFSVPSLGFGAFQDGEIGFHAAAGSLWSYKMA